MVLCVSLWQRVAGRMTTPCTRYLAVTGVPGSRVGTPLASIEEVVIFCWGRDMAHVTLYDGECPYHFRVGCLRCIETVLLWYPTRVVRLYTDVWPWALRAGGLHPLGVGKQYATDTLVCTIGSEEEPT